MWQKNPPATQVEDDLQSVVFATKLSHRLFSVVVWENAQFGGEGGSKVDIHLGERTSHTLQQQEVHVLSRLGPKVIIPLASKQYLR